MPTASFGEEKKVCSRNWGGKKSKFQRIEQEDSVYWKFKKRQNVLRLRSQDSGYCGETVTKREGGVSGGGFL